MLKMTIDNEEVLSDNDISIKEEILSPSSTILNNVYPKSWELDKDYISRFYYPKDYSKLNIQNFNIEPEEAGTTIQINGSATLTDVDTSKESRVLRLLGQTSQVSYSGINLIEPKLPTQTISGITLTNNWDGSYKINGTATANTSFRIDQSTATGSDNLKDYNGTYTLSCNELTSGMQLVLMDKEAYSIVMRMNGNNTPVTATINEEGCFIYVYVANGTTINNLMIKPMLEKSSSASAWQPYVGGIPSPNPSYPQPINVVSGDNTIDICGKNLFDGKIELGNINPSDGSLSSNNSRTRSKNFIKVQPNTTYTMKRSVGSSRWVIGYTKGKVGITDGNFQGYASALTSFGSISQPQQFTTSPTTEYIKWYDTNSTDLEEQVMIIKGNYVASTMPPYEPYIGNSYPLYLGVENLFDISTNTDGKVLASNGAITDDVKFTISDYIKVLPNTKYTISWVYDSSQGSDTAMRVGYYQSDKTFISRPYNTTSPYTITTPNNCYYIRLCYEISSHTQIQVAIGTNHISTTPIELCKIGTYQDYIYKDNGSWYLHKEIGKVVLNGSESWAKYSGTKRYYLQMEDILTPSTNNEKALIISNLFTVQTANYTSGATTVDAIALQTDGILLVRYVAYNDETLANFKTWLSTNNIRLYYVLPTPTNTLIEDTTLINQLESLSS